MALGPQQAGDATGDGRFRRHQAATPRIRAGTRGAVVLLLVLAWTGAQAWWLHRDERIVDGDEMGNVGAVELFWSEAHQATTPAVLWKAYTQDFGEYPALYAAVVGAVAARVGVKDLDGDGPAGVALVLWGWLAAAATAALAAALALRGGVPVGSTSVGAVVLLLCSPLWSALQRHVMLENGLAALGVSVGACLA